MSQQAYREVKSLTPDQFELREDGQLVIKDEELTAALRSAAIQQSDQAAEAGGISVSVEIGISL